MSESLGTQLKTPETGWTRVYNTDSNFSYSGFASGNDSNMSSGRDYYTGSSDSALLTTYAYACIGFTGTKLRILGIMTNSTYCTKNFIVSVYIDGIYSGRLYDKLDNSYRYRSLLYEKTDLSNTKHSLEIRVEKGSTRFWFDSIDIGTEEATFKYSTNMSMNQTIYDEFASSNIEYVNALQTPTSDTVISAMYAAEESGAVGIFSDWYLGKRDYFASTIHYTEYKIGQKFKFYNSANETNTSYSLDEHKFAFNLAIDSKGLELTEGVSFKKLIQKDNTTGIYTAIPNDVILISKEAIDLKCPDQMQYIEFAGNSNINAKFVISPNGTDWFYYHETYQAWYQCLVTDVTTTGIGMDKDKLQMVFDRKGWASFEEIGGDPFKFYIAMSIGITPPSDMSTFDIMEDYSVNKIRFVYNTDYDTDYTYDSKSTLVNFYYEYNSDRDDSHKSYRRNFIADQVVQLGSAYTIFTNNSIITSDTNMALFADDYTNMIYLADTTADNATDSTSDYDKYIFSNSDKYNLGEDGTYAWADYRTASSTEYLKVSTFDNQKVTTSTAADSNTGFRPKLMIDKTSKVYHRTDSETKLPVVKSLKNANPGEAVKVAYKSLTKGAFGTFSMDTQNKKIIPDYSSDTPDGYFYFICVGTAPNGNKKFVADRNIQKNISWETLNTAGVCVTSGLSLALGGARHCHMRLFNTTSAETAGIYDLNEWDAIISYYNTNGITPSSNEVWNALSMYSWTMTTPQGTMANRIVRGYQDYDTIAETYTQTNYVSTYTADDVGFRPILEVEPDRDDGETYPTCELEIANSIGDCQPGQAILAQYRSDTAGAFGKFFFNPKSTKELISDPASETPNGSFYFVCVGYAPNGNKKFVADRNIQTGISWETLNTAGVCVTSGLNIDSRTKYIGSTVRLMQSDVTNYDMDLTSSEWDAIMMTDNIGATDISAEKCNYWNMQKTMSWMLNTPHGSNFAGNVGSMSDRVIRGKENRNYNTQPSLFSDSSNASSGIGFRPVLEVSLRYTTVTCDCLIDATHPYEKNENNKTIHFDYSFEFISERFSLSDVTFRFAVGDTQLTNEDIPALTLDDNGLMTVDSYNFSFDVDIDKFAYGTNTFYIYAKTVDPEDGKIVENAFEYTITREKAKDRTKTRDYNVYTGGFEYNKLITEDTSVIDENRTFVTKTPTSIKIPDNPIKITLTEV